MRIVNKFSAVSILALALVACSGDDSGDVFNDPNAGSVSPGGDTSGSQPGTPTQTTVAPSGGIADGTLNADGSVTNADGSVTQVGETLPNGNVLLEDGTVRMPDGTVTDSEGVVVTVADRPADMISEGAVINDEGTIILADGVTAIPPGGTMPNGSTNNGDGTLTTPDGAIVNLAGDVLVEAPVPADTGTGAPGDVVLDATTGGSTETDEECIVVKENVPPETEIQERVEVVVEEVVEELVTEEIIETLVEHAPKILFVIDTSSSMTQDAPGYNGNKWEATREAMLAAVAQMPQSWAVGINYYPNLAGSTGNPNCYLAEVGVQMGPLDDAQRQAILNDLSAKDTGVGTPTTDAWQYGVDTLLAAVLPEEYDESIDYVVVITDGVPTWTDDCGAGIAPIPTAAYNALIAEVGAATTADPPVSTFVIGSPGSEDNQGADYDNREMMSRMAAAGGTATEGCVHTGPNYCHFDMTQEPEFLTALVAALGDIITEITSQVEVTVEEEVVEVIEEVVSEVETEQTFQEEVDLCTYILPEPPPGQDLVLSEVLARYFPGGGTTGQEILRTTDTTEPCAVGWRFDDPNNPTMIEFCTETCAMIQADPNARVEIEIGCYEVG